MLGRHLIYNLGLEALYYMKCATVCDLFINVFFFFSVCRGLKDLEQDSSSMEKRIAYKFLKRLLSYVDSAQEFIAHLGEKR